jgi:hypothetical protein
MEAGMKLLKLALAAAVAFGAIGAAQAQDRHRGDRDRHWQDGRDGRWHGDRRWHAGDRRGWERGRGWGRGWGWGRHCRWIWRHRHRELVCWR